MALHHAKAGEIVDLQPMGPKLKHERTTAIVKTKQFEAIRLVVLAGVEIPSHKVAGSRTLHCLEGAVELGLETESVVLNANAWMFLDAGAPHSIKAITDASLLLTIFLEPPAVLP